MKTRPNLHTDRVSNDAHRSTSAASFSHFVRTQLAGWISLSALMLVPAATLIPVETAQADHVRNCRSTRNVSYRRVSYCNGNGSSVRDVSTSNDWVLSLGDEGTAVAALQRRLTNLGYPVTVDGVFGFETEQAVMAFQADNGLAVDGVVGSATGNALLLDSERSVSWNPPSSSPQSPSRNGPYVVVIPTASGARLSEVQRYFPDARSRSHRLGSFIETGAFNNRSQAESRSRSARSRGFDAQVRYFR